MLETGILSEDDRVELLGGEIVEMTPIGGRHVRTVNRLTMLLAPLAAEQGLVLSVQNPLILDDDNEPEPDLTLLKDDVSRRDTGMQRVPAASDALLVVEVSETSLSWDRNVKTPRYARAGIPEVWLVDPASGTLEIYADPQASGRYVVARSVAGEEEELSCGALGALGARLTDIL